MGWASWLAHAFRSGSLARITLVEQAVLVAIAIHADGNGHARPGISCLSRLLGAHPREVRRYIGRLEARGYLRVERRSGRANRYRLWIPGVNPPPVAPTPSQVTTADSKSSTRGESTPTPGVNPPPEVSKERKESVSLSAFSEDPYVAHQTPQQKLHPTPPPDNFPGDHTRTNRLSDLRFAVPLEKTTTTPRGETTHA